MVQEANIKRAQAEKTLAESEMKVKISIIVLLPPDCIH